MKSNDAAKKAVMEEKIKKSVAEDQDVRHKMNGLLKFYCGFCGPALWYTWVGGILLVVAAVR